MNEPDADVVQPEMLRRPVNPARYGGVVRPDKTVRWAADELDQVRHLRGRSPDAWPTPAALPESLDRLAVWLTELGWDDLACLARREEVAVCRELSAARPGLFADRVVRALIALRGSLMECGRHEEALEVVEELLRLAETSRAAQAEAPDARYWRTLLLARLGRDQEAVESAAEAVAELRERLRRTGATSAGFELIHALTAYADRLDEAGRVAEAAEVSAEVMAAWWEQAGSTIQFLHALDLCSERLVRSGRPEQARACIVEAMGKLLRRERDTSHARVWHNLGVRLLTLGAAEPALTAGEEAVRLYRDRARAHRERHRELRAEDDWDDDHRYSEAYLLKRRREELRSSRKEVRRAEQDLYDALLALSACLRQVGRLDDAAAAGAEAAALLG
jgi:tetratricopeptide (TPR) repeat protein